MTTYSTLKKIIPPDQALANQALSRALRQVKDIFNTDLPELSAAVSQLESNKDLGLINALTTPIPAEVSAFIGNAMATGSGPNDTITTNDIIGIAAGATVTTELPVVTTVINELGNVGALDVLTANGGSSGSAVNGVYTVMSYCLANAYTSVTTGPPDTFTIIIPAPLPGQGTYGPDTSFTTVIDAAFVNLISNAETRIANIAANYSNLATQANEATDACARQLAVNVTNCQAAGIDIGNVVNDIANANLVANSTSTVLGFVSQLHDLGLDVTEGGSAQFLNAIANTSTITGQAVIASMREGRNIAVLNAVGIQLDTQLVDVNPDVTVANNLGDAQYTVTEARANIVL